MQPVGVAIVGRGFGATVHEPGWRLLEPIGVRVEGIAGRNDWRELVARGAVGIVSVASPPAAHREVAEAALAAGKAVLCEKPLAATLEDAEAMAAAAAGTTTAVNFSYRALPAFRLARSLVAEGRLGEAHTLDVEWRTGSRLRRLAQSWKDRPAEGGGALAAYGVHALDYAQWLLGPARVVRASLAGPTDDACEVELEHARGARSRIAVSLVSPSTLHRVSIRGSAATLTLENADARDPVRRYAVTLDGRTLEPGSAAFPAPEAVDPRAEPFAAHAAGLVAAVRAQTAYEPSFADGLAAQRLLESARRAGKLGSAR